MAESRKYATDLDLQGNSIINGGFEQVVVLPLNGYDGQTISFRGKQYIWYNGKWNNVADDLGGVEETREEQFTFQPTANDESVKDGLAIVKSIKGNTVVANQLIKNGDFSNGIAGWILYNLNIQDNNDYLSLSREDTNLYNSILSQPITVIQNHVYLVTFTYRGNLRLYCADDRQIFYDANDFTKVNYIVTGNGYNYLRFYPSYSCDLKKDIRVFDLTQMFGAGNEPTVEEFERLYPNLPKEYNTGSLLNLNAEAIKSVGFNAFNGEYAQVLGGMQYYLGGNITSLTFKENLEDEGEVIEIPGDNLYTPNTNGYLVATGNDICINLSHSGYRNGEYESYKESISELPIKKYFTDGMKSAGKVRDEIIWDESIGKYKAIRRIGSLLLSDLSFISRAANDYQWGFFALIPKSYNVYIKNAIQYKENAVTPLCPIDTADAVINRNKDAFCLYHSSNNDYFIYKNSKYNYATDLELFQQSLQGQILYYELETPIETIIDDYDLIDYEVSDFGTEEILSDEPTTPIIAYIQYGFNAVDEIRNHRFEIRDLKKLISRGVNLNGVNVKLGDTSTIPAYIPYDDVLYPVRIQGNWLQIYRNGVWGNLFNLASEVIPSLYLEEFEGDWYNPNILEYILSDELTTKLISETLDFRSILTSIQGFAGVKLSLQSFSPKEYDKSLANILNALTGYVVYVENDIDTMFNSGNNVLVKLNFDVVNRVTIECYIQR